MKPVWIGLGVTVGALLLVVFVFGAVLGPDGVRRGLIDLLTPEYHPEGDPGSLKASFVAPDDTRERVDVSLTKVAGGLTLPVDIQFVPGHAAVMLVLEQHGNVVRVDSDGGLRKVLHLDVVSGGERGLLGLTFHPSYASNGRFYLNATVASAEAEKTQITAWKVAPGSDFSSGQPDLLGIVIEVEQPYQNHNGGQLAFGPDGMLYVGLGDGGFADDPHGHGQNTQTLLGSMLRLDVDRTENGAQYAIPPDNPFVGKEGFRPEIWAFGLRNPWRYSFAPDGRLIVAEVGQDLFEEITVVGAGENHGWAVREAAHCFPPKARCSADGMVDPLWEYPREEGASITGGHVYLGTALPALKGHYVFADFVSGRLWALPLLTLEPVPKTLGKWPILPSTFGRDAAGEIYLADFGRGDIYRLDAP
jgi:glucose/arabinose dehydrogenase